MKLTVSIVTKLYIFISIITIVTFTGCGKKTDEAATVSADSLKMDSALFKVETIIFKNEGTGTSSNIPHFVSLNNDTTTARLMNNAIKDYFQLSSFEPDKEKDFSWSDVNFTSEVGKDVVVLNIKGTYVAAYPTDYDEAVFISMKDGKVLHNVDISFPALFKEDGFFSVTDQYWKGKAQQKFVKAAQCASDLAPTCSLYGINFKVEGKNAVLTLNNQDCYPHVAAACSPSLEVNIPIEKLKPFLSDFGNKVIESGYFQKTSPLDRYQAAEQLKATMPNRLFIRLKRSGFQIENGPFFDFPETSIGITFNETKKMEGNLTSFWDMDALPADFRSTDAFSISDTPINYTGTFNYDGFVLTVECEPMNSNCIDQVTFTWGSEPVEGAIAVGHRWLSCDAGALLFAGYSNEDFFYSANLQNGQAGNSDSN
jgi:hypothetical protein